jgi:predicted phosphoribosyltransferase
MSKSHTDPLRTKSSDTNLLVLKKERSITEVEVYGYGEGRKIEIVDKGIQTGNSILLCSKLTLYINRKNN